ncbi:nitrogenase component 1 [Clostridiaceae bacterium M8S5]|nr:nitrogenase component 1 [Clostridiaceae bacterium M8S5]
MINAINSKRLSKIKNSASIPFASPAVSPGVHCPMRMASAIVEDIKGLSSLLVGMPECANHSRLFTPNPEGEHGELHWMYVLDSREVIFGCRDGVIDALKKMDKAGAKSILLIATCIPDLIGEDFEGVIHEIQAEISAKVTFTMLGQFKNISYPSGAWKTMESLARLMKPQPAKANCINILGDLPEKVNDSNSFLYTLLEKHGFKLRFLAPGAEIEDFINAPDATINLVVSPYTHALAVKMKEIFKVPFISLHHRYSIDEIDKAFLEIMTKFGIPLNNEFRQIRLETIKLQEEARRLLANQNFLITTRVDLPLPLTKFLVKSINMNPSLIHLEEYYPEDDIHYKELKKIGCDPLVCRIVNERNAKSLVEELKPDLCIGHIPGLDKAKSVVGNMFDFYGQVGYERTKRVLERIIKSVI